MPPPPSPPRIPGQATCAEIHAERKFAAAVTCFQLTTLLQAGEECTDFWTHAAHGEDYACFRVGSFCQGRLLLDSPCTHPPLHPPSPFAPPSGPPELEAPPASGASGGGDIVLALPYYACTCPQHPSAPSPPSAPPHPGWPPPRGPPPPPSPPSPPSPPPSPPSPPPPPPPDYQAVITGLSISLVVVSVATIASLSVGLYQYMFPGAPRGVEYAPGARKAEPLYRGAGVFSSASVRAYMAASGWGATP